MEESLVCTKCKVKWSRTLVRGRKPILCPTCLDSTSLPKTSRKTKSVKKSVKLSSKKIYPPAPEQVSSSLSDLSSLSKAKIMQMCHPKPANYKELQESTENGSVWKCKSCGHILKLEVAITDIPLHRCTPDTVSLKLYERIK